MKLADRKLRGAQAIEERIWHRRFVAGLRRFDNFLFRHAEREIQIHPIGQAANVPFVDISVRQQ